MARMTNPALFATMSELAAALEAAAILARDAARAAEQGENNLAIGTLMPAQREIEAVEPLMKAAFAIHRRIR